MSNDVKNKAPDHINMTDIITLTARLAQLLAEEVDQLGGMKIAKVRELQKEKLFILSALEAHKRILEKHPHLSETIPSRDKSDLEAVVRVFEDILEENHRRLMVAREVNQRVVNAITEVVRDNSMSKVYGAKGVTGALGGDSLSITLNHTA
jgi:flagellar biosynthesis/type III secretory pathway chaperone